MPGERFACGGKLRGAYELIQLCQTRITPLASEDGVGLNAGRMERQSVHDLLHLTWRAIYRSDRQEVELTEFASE